MKRERSKMFREVAMRASEVTTRLGVSSLGLAPSHDDVAAFLLYFTQLVDKLEKAVKKVDELVDAECLDLLALAGSRILSNLVHANPGFQVETVLKEVDELGLDDAARAKLAAAV